MAGHQETYENDHRIEPRPLRGHLLTATTLALGPDPGTAPRETVALSGFCQWNHWPLPGLESGLDDHGRSTFDLALPAAPEIGVTGHSHLLAEPVQLTPHPGRPGTGRVRQQHAGTNYPAELALAQHSVLETTTRRLAARTPLALHGTLDQFPPYAAPLAAPYTGALPAVGGPGGLPTGPGVLRADPAELPLAWYPADDRDEPAGESPELHFLAAPVALTTLLLHPDLVLRATAEAQLTVEVDGRTEQIELSGARQAAGVEILFFGPDRHREGSGVRARLTRLALEGHSTALGGRVALRVSWPQVSGGTLGDGSEQRLGEVRFPGELALDAHLKLVTPDAVLAAQGPARLTGKLPDLEARGAELGTGELALPLVPAGGGAARAGLRGLRLVLHDTAVGETALLNA